MSEGTVYKKEGGRRGAWRSDTAWTGVKKGTDRDRQGEKR